MKRPLLIVALVFCILAAIYSFLGITMAVWVAQVPGNTPERIRLNFLIWVPATILFAVLALACLYRLLTRDG